MDVTKQYNYVVPHLHSGRLAIEALGLVLGKRAN